MKNRKSPGPENIPPEIIKLRQDMPKVGPFGIQNLVFVSDSDCDGGGKRNQITRDKQRRSTRICVRTSTVEYPVRRTPSHEATGEYHTCRLRGRGCYGVSTWMEGENPQLAPQKIEAVLLTMRRRKKMSHQWNQHPRHHSYFKQGQ